MRDDELQRIIAEIDSALQIFRHHRVEDFDADDLKIRSSLAELRRDLAVYRAISDTRSNPSRQ